jgi:hypothetical protein
MKNEKDKTSKPTKGNLPESSHYIISHYNIGVTKDFFNTSYTPWKDA